MHHTTPPLVFGLEDLQAAATTDALSDIWTEFLHARDLPDDTDAQVFNHADIADLAWVAAFIARWDVVQDEEDFAVACRLRGEALMPTIAQLQAAAFAADVRYQAALDAAGVDRWSNHTGFEHLLAAKVAAYEQFRRAAFPHASR